MSLKRGEYFVGDPSYVLNSRMMVETDLTWDLILNQTGHFGIYIPWTNKPRSNPSTGIFKIEGFNLFASSTTYGDGVYLDQRSNRYCVDSGLIGAVPVDLIRKLGGDESVSRLSTEFFASLGRVFTFDKDFYCELCDEDGDITIGSVVISTDDFSRYG